MKKLLQYIKKPAGAVWDIILSIAGPLLVFASMLLYASSLMFIIPIFIIYLIIKGIIEDDQQKKRFQELDRERVKSYPKDKYGKPLWEELNALKSTESLLVETNNDTTLAKKYAKEQINIALNRIEQLENSNKLDIIESEKTKSLANIDKWNNIIINIERTSRNNNIYNAKKAFKIFLAVIISAGVLSFAILLISAYFRQNARQSDNHSQEQKTSISYYSLPTNQKNCNEYSHNESEELKKMLLLSDEIDIYRDIDEEYYNHPISYQLPQPTVTINTTTTHKDERMVYICTGPSAYRYHSRKSCRGLNRCSDDIERITISEAHDLGRTPCGYCY